MRDRGARIAAHVGDPGLEQRLGDGEDPLAPEHLPVAQRELLDLLREGPFHGVETLARLGRAGSAEKR